MTEPFTCSSPPTDGKPRTSRFRYLLAILSDWIRPPSETLIKDLESGTTVLCDRYAFSGIAFSAAKHTDSSSTSTLSYEWCRSPDTYLPAPDLVLFLNVSPSVAQARGGYGEERYEKESVQARVRTVFERIEEDFVTSGGGGAWVNVDASGTVQAVEHQMWEQVGRLAKGVERQLGRLWI